MTSPTYDKRHGQHHLARPELCRPAVEFLRPEGATVVEVGPGGGALTGELLAAGARVLACEIDARWAFELRARLRVGGPQPLALAIADALDLRWDRLPPGSLVAGNLPYNIATALVLRVLRHPGRIARAAFLVQLEVAGRLTAGPGDGDYGSLSVIAATRADVRRLGAVKRASFVPPPRVDGAFVGFTLREPTLPERELRAFERFVRLAFALRRKTLRNSLATGWGRAAAERLLTAAGLDGRVRAESLSPQELLSLYQLAAEDPELPMSHRS